MEVLTKIELLDENIDADQVPAIKKFIARQKKEPYVPNR